MAKRKAKKTAKATVMRITEARKQSIKELASLLSGIAPATARGNKSFCVQRVAEDKGLRKCWKEQSNKKKTIAHLLENTCRQFPQKPKRLVLAVVKGGVEWSAKSGRAVTREELEAIAVQMESLGFDVRSEFAALELPDPSRVVLPPLDLSSIIDRLDLHEALRDDCITMFKDGHLNEAVRKAFERFEKRVQDETGDHSIGKMLMGKAFNAQNPVISINDGSAGNDSSEQEGFMHLTMGAMAAFRNLYSHGDVETMTPMDALERLAFASLLFKRLDEALIQTANP